MDSVSFGQFPSVEESLKNRIPLKEWKCNEPKDYEEIKTVGLGSFGKVFKAIYKKDTKEQRLVALKKIKIFEEEGFPVTALREILIMQKLNHKNILKLEEILYTQPKEKNKKRGNVYLVFPYMDQDLSGVRMNEISFNLRQIKYITYQILSGMAYLHKCKIIHRDIKSSNILMNTKGEICIGDYGLARKDSKENNKNYTYKVVTLCYRAPELLLGSKEYGTEIDIWSVGCVFAELLTGNILFYENGKEKEQLNKIFSICGTPNEKNWPGISSLPNYKSFSQKTIYKNNLREHFKDNKLVDDVTFDLLNKLLDLNPKKRITAEEALNHDFFKVEPKMCTPEELPKIDEFHEFQTEKDKKELKKKLGDLKIKQEMEIGNKDFIGKKRNDSISKDITPMKSGGKMKYS